MSLACFLTNDIETQKILISLASNIIQIIAVVVGIIIAIIQIRKSHTNSLSLQKENLKNEHYSKLHNEIENVIESLSESECDLSSSLGSVSLSFVLLNISHQAGIQNPSTNTDSFRAISSKKAKLNKAHIQLLSIIEKYEIVEPKIRIFKLAFNIAMEDVDSVYLPLQKELVKILPNHDAKGVPIPYRPPSNQKEQEIKLLIDNCVDKLMIVGNYTYDLRVEIQNLLLSGLFERKLESRKPLDPNLIVISTEANEYDILYKQFETEIDIRKSKIDKK